MKDKIFVNGLISKEVPDTAPDFVLGKLSINIDELVAFLVQAKKYAVKGWINATILKSKAGKRYIELDLYQWLKENDPVDEYKPDPALVKELDDLKKRDMNPDTIKVEEIPF